MYAVTSDRGLRGSERGEVRLLMKHSYRQTVYLVMDHLLMVLVLLWSSVLLVGGASRCAGTLEVKQGEWRPVSYHDWTLKAAADSVRLVNGTSLCSGRLEVKSEQSWSSVCEADFDQQDAEVVCRELGCGAPSVLQGALYGEVEAPMWTKEFQCGGHESALLDCGRSDSARSTCSPGKAVGLTCSEPVRLVGGASRCAGTLEVKHGDWRPVHYAVWTLKEAAVFCSALHCGSAISTERRNEPSRRYVWWIDHDCVHSGSALRDCLSSESSSSIVELTCSDLLVQPIISVSSTMDGVSEAQQQGFQVRRGSNFTISCSVLPQYPGGSFQLTFTSSNMAHNYTQPAVNHSADFLFPAADPAHQGNYSCVYGVYVFYHNFSSKSRLLSLTVTDPTVHIIRDPDETHSRKVFIITLVVLLVTPLLFITAIYFILKASRGQRSGPQENIGLDSYNLGVSRAEGEPAEEEGAQGAE
ncbi:deleted in malignant brain tumors 1 protein-like [Thunnus albacares]|uniref:deleted in malignant brain tumors 1 protein-like n=1 Tax=Thunnus albacares TaxID=8236 RepID=UPI001CF6FC77|nr:deleted in malignant brain tumors 1 protein-like [Thunnus albacares]